MKEKKIGEQLRKLREGRGMSQTDLARKVRCSQENISVYENSDMSMQLGTIKRIAKALGARATLVIEEVKRADAVPADG